MEFWTYYRILRRRRWIIMAALLIALGAALVLNRPQISDFGATATLSVPSVQRFSSTAGTSATGPSTLPTPEDIKARTDLALSRIRSREVALRVITKLGLNVRPEELTKRISSVRDPVSNLIKVSVSGATPQDAIVLANTVAETAAAYDQEVQRRETTMAREFFEKQAAGVRAGLQNAENALLAFLQQNGSELAAPKNTQVGPLESEMRATNLSLAEIQVKLTALLAAMSGQSVVRADRQISDNPVAAQLRAELVQLEVALTSELAIRTEKYPPVIALKAKIEAIKDRLRTELNQIVSQEQVKFNPVYDALSQNRINLETEKLALQARKEALQRAINEAERGLPGLAQKQLEQTRLTRNVEILSKQITDLEAQVAQARIREQESQNLGSLSVVEHARAAQLAPFGGLRFKLTLASVLALLGGAGLAFFLEYLDNSLTPEHVERLLGVPALATIPRHNPPFNEAYRLLRINLGPYLRPEGADAIVVTGPRPKVGASTVVSNLARAFARAGQNTIVVDADVRRPTQHTNFGVSNDKGLIEVLTGTVPLQEALVKTDVPNLRLLPSRTSAAEDGALLGSRAMACLLEDLKRTRDVILIDAPPGGAFSDVFAMAPLASGVLLVLEAGRPPRGVEKQVKVQLERLGAKVLGAVLTKVRPDLVDSYYFQRFYKTASRPRLSPATSGAAALLLGLVLGAIGTGVPQRAGQAVSKWVSPAIQNAVAEAVAPLYKQ